MICPSLKEFIPSICTIGTVGSSPKTRKSTIFVIAPSFTSMPLAYFSISSGSAHVKPSGLRGDSSSHFLIWNSKLYEAASSRVPNSAMSSSLISALVAQSGQ